MDFQLFAVWAFIGGAGAYLLFVALRGWRRIRQGKCSTSCGCAAKPKAVQPPLIEANDLALRLQQKRHA